MLQKINILHVWQDYFCFLLQWDSIVNCLSLSIIINYQSFEQNKELSPLSKKSIIILKKKKIQFWTTVMNFELEFSYLMNCGKHVENRLLVDIFSPLFQFKINSRNSENTSITTRREWIQNCNDVRWRIGR